MSSQRDSYLKRFVSDYLENGNSRLSEFYHEDPTTLGFNLFFHFDDAPQTLPGTSLSPLFNEDPTRESAIRYLRSVDEPGRSESLRRFKERLRRLVRETPYYFQNLSGMENMYDFNLDVFSRNLKVDTLESIDLRVATMINRYIEGTMDYLYDRYVIPTNLMEFTCVVMVSEIRNFRKVVRESLTDNPDFQLINDQIGVHSYVFRRCRFDFSESNPFTGELSNQGGDPVVNQFSIIPGMATFAHNLNLIQLTSSAGQQVGVSDPDLSPGPLDRATIEVAGREATSFRSEDLGSLPIGDRFGVTFDERVSDVKVFLRDFFQREKQFLEDKLDLGTLGQRAINDLFDQVETRVKGLALGNIFSDYRRFRNRDLYDSLRSYVLDIFDRDKNNVSPVPQIERLSTSGPTALGSLDEIGLSSVPLNFRDVLLGNVEGFLDDPFSATVNTVIAGSLGNIFDGSR